MISPSPWTVREGRSTRYLYVCDAEGTKIAEVDLWTATTNDAVLMASGPTLLAAAKMALHVAETWIHDHPDGTRSLAYALAELEPMRSAIAAAETPFVQGYKPVVSAE